MEVYGHKFPCFQHLLGNGGNKEGVLPSLPPPHPAF